MPRHYCQRPANHTAATVNGSGAWLRATVPLDLLGAPETCRHFTQPQCALLGPNTSVHGAATKGRKDDSVYDRSVFPSTIVMEVGVGPGWGAGGAAARGQGWSVPPFPVVGSGV